MERRREVGTMVDPFWRISNKLRTNRVRTPQATVLFHRNLTKENSLSLSLEEVGWVCRGACACLGSYPAS